MQENRQPSQPSSIADLSSNSATIMVQLYCCSSFERHILPIRLTVFHPSNKHVKHSTIIIDSNIATHPTTLRTILLLKLVVR